MYLSLNGEVIPTHGYVVISDIGSTDDTALICHTNRPATFRNNNGIPNSGGGWFRPDQSVVQFHSLGLWRNRGPMIVRLHRNTAHDPPAEGIYHCVIENDTLTEQTVYVALYNSGRGI